MEKKNVYVEQLTFSTSGKTLSLTQSTFTLPIPTTSVLSLEFSRCLEKHVKLISTRLQLVRVAPEDEHFITNSSLDDDVLSRLSHKVEKKQSVAGCL